MNPPAAVIRENNLPAGVRFDLGNLVNAVDAMPLNVARRFLALMNNMDLPDLARLLTAGYLRVLVDAFGVGVNALVIDLVALNQQFRGLDIDHRRNLVGRALDMMPWGAIPLNYRDWLVVYAEVEIVGGGM